MSENFRGQNPSRGLWQCRHVDVTFVTKVPHASVALPSLICMQHTAPPIANKLLWGTVPQDVTLPTPRGLKANLQQQIKQLRLKLWRCCEHAMRVSASRGVAVHPSNHLTQLFHFPSASHCRPDGAVRASVWTEWTARVENCVCDVCTCARDCELTEIFF